MTFYKSKTPFRIFDIIDTYYKISQKAEKTAFIQIEHRQKMVEELIKVYKTLRYNERRNLLIPASADFLEDGCIMKKPDIDFEDAYAFLYRWPNVKIKSPIMISNKLYIDRIGGEYGYHVCPLDSNTPFSIGQRSLPYYFFDEEMLDITKCPSYHKYEVLFPKCFCNATMSITKPAFNQIGGSKEIRLQNDIFCFLESGLLKEIEYAKR